MEGFSQSQEHIPTIVTEKSFEDFVPKQFRTDPIGYFESQGVNIKSGDLVRDETGRVREDPTAVKDLPVWSNAAGQELYVVGKRVNTHKSKVGKTGDPFYEYGIMEIAQEFGLPASRPIAKVSYEQEHLIVMTRIPGLGWNDKNAIFARVAGLSEEDIKELKHQVQAIMARLREQYERVGIYREWDLKDMILDVNLENKVVNSVTPTDWEKTKIDQQKLQAARQLVSSAQRVL